MEESEIRARLEEAQKAVLADEAKANRRKIVMIAIDHGWTKYKIAAALDVKGPTVDSIIKTAEKEGGKSKEAAAGHLGRPRRGDSPPE